LLDNKSPWYDISKNLLEAKDKQDQRWNAFRTELTRIMDTLVVDLLKKNRKIAQILVLVFLYQHIRILLRCPSFVEFAVPHSEDWPSVLETCREIVCIDFPETIPELAQGFEDTLDDFKARLNEDPEFLESVRDSLQVKIDKIRKFELDLMTQVDSLEDLAFAHDKSAPLGTLPYARMQIDQLFSDLRADLAARFTDNVYWKFLSNEGCECLVNAFCTVQVTMRITSLFHTQHANADYAKKLGIRLLTVEQVENELTDLDEVCFPKTFLASKPKVHFICRVRIGINARELECTLSLSPVIAHLLFSNNSDVQKRTHSLLFSKKRKKS
jgi:hypothetical protein